MSQHRDVIVVGLGGTGSSATYELAQRGARVLGLDECARPYEREAGHTRVLRNAYPDHPAYVPMLMRAWELWRGLEQASGLDLLRINGGLMIGPGGGRLVGETIRATEQWGTPAEVLGASDIARTFPAFRVDTDDLAVFDPWAGFVRTGAAVAAQLRQAKRCGAQLQFGERVMDWDVQPQGRGVRVSTGSGTYLADRLVLCPGTGSARMLPELGVDLHVQRQVRARFRPGKGRATGGVQDHLVSVGEDADGHQVSVLPGDRGTGEVTALSSAGSRLLPSDVGGLHHRALNEYVSWRLPGWTGVGDAAPILSTTTADGRFVLGRHPLHDDVTVACGLSEHGCGFAPVLGEIIADLVLDSSTIHPIELFGPDRDRARDVTGSRI